MPIAQTETATSRKPLRLWPGVLVAALIVVARLVVPLIVSDAPAYGILAALAGSAIIVVWWVFFSRAPWVERLGAIVLIGLAVFATKFVVHPSIADGFMGRMLYVYAAPLTVSLAFVAWAVATRRLPDGVRRVTMVVAILLGCGVWTLARSGGISGEGGVDLHWRWTPTPEQRLLAEARDDVPAPPAAPAAVTVAEEHPATPAAPAAAPPAATVEAVVPAAATSEPEWPGFRGPHRDSIIGGTRLDTDWAASPPVQLWRKPIGPGWSSFAVHGDRVYTQEQRGEDELVSCYRLKTGEPVWRHRDRARFYESNGGPGPRATPTLHHGRVYTMGATGIVNVLDETTGAVIWSRNAATDTGAPMPGWGYTGSPLIVNDAVIVSTSGRLVSYDLATGRPRWTHTTGGSGYSSPHFVTIDGVAQILLLTGNGATSVAPADGTRLWQHLWDVGVAIVQPGLAGDHDILIGLGDAMGGQGLRRVAVARHPSGWTAEERWTTRALKPYFNDFVVHEGHAFGFDGSILACIDLADGTRTWKGGRFGHGQLVLLPDQDLLLVLSEEGELALVSATPDRFTEVARAPAIEGKTWNHPVLAGDILLVRNDQEMAAFRLAVAGR